MEYADAGDHGEDEDFFKLRHEQKTVKKLHMETDAMLSLKERKVEKKKRDITARVKKSEKLGLSLESGRDSDNHDGAAARDNVEDNNKVGDGESSAPAWCSIFDKQNLELFIFIYLLETRLTN